MNKRVTPQQLDMVQELSREELILAAAPHIDPDSPQLKADLEKIEKIAREEAARAVLSGPDYDDFDWGTDPSVVLHEQRATAIYRNRHNGIVIRQERTWDEDSDPFMIISDDNAITFAEAFAKVQREG